MTVSVQQVLAGEWQDLAVSKIENKYCPQELGSADEIVSRLRIHLAGIDYRW
jgi:hypothetical protein